MCKAIITNLLYIKQQRSQYPKLPSLKIAIFDLTEFILILKQQSNFL